jgi:hypothetical protein
VYLHHPFISYRLVATAQNVPYVQNAVLWSSIHRGIVLTRSQNDYFPWPRISFLGNALSIFLLFVEPVETLTCGGILCDIGPRAHLPSTRPAGSLSIPPGVALRGAAYSSDFVFFVLRLEGRRCRLVVRAKPVCSSWAIFPHFSTFSRLGKIAMPGRWSFSLYHRFVSVCRDPRRITYSVDVLLSPGSSWQLLSAFCFE